MQFGGYRLRLFALVALAAAASVRADSINYAGLVVHDVIIDKFENGVVFYRTSSGTSDQRKVTDRVKINVADEPNLDIAEDAYGAKNWSDAVDGYMKAISSTNKPWVREYASARLAVAAEKSHRFDAAVAAWLQVVDHDPKSAAAHTPALPADPNSAYLKTAALQLEKAAALAASDADKVATIRSYQLQVARAMHDDQMISELAAQLTAIISQNKTNTASQDVRAVMEAELGLVRVALDQKDFATAKKKLQQIKPSVIEPGDQADWLWYQAQARAGQLGESKDADTLKEVELAYMQVVADFPNYAQTPQALFNTAQLMERGGDAKTALNVYQQISREYADKPIAQKAADEAHRVQSELKQ